MYKRQDKFQIPFHVAEDPLYAVAKLSLIHIWVGQIPTLYQLLPHPFNRSKCPIQCRPIASCELRGQMVAPLAIYLGEKRTKGMRVPTGVMIPSRRELKRLTVSGHQHPQYMHRWALIGSLTSLLVDRDTTIPHRTHQLHLLLTADAHLAQRSTIHPNSVDVYKRQAIKRTILSLTSLFRLPEVKSYIPATLSQIMTSNLKAR